MHIMPKPNRTGDTNLDTLHEKICHIAETPFYMLLQGGKILTLTFSESSHLRNKNILLSLFPDSVILPENQKRDCPRIKDFIYGDSTLFPLEISSFFLDRGTAFQKHVWSLIREIPHGKTETYGELAKKLGGKKYSRAVGMACNANPLALVIPCHRVTGADSIGGFAGGIHIKQKLLDLEKNCNALKKAGKKLQISD